MGSKFGPYEVELSDRIKLRVETTTYLDFRIYFTRGQNLVHRFQLRFPLLPLDQAEALGKAIAKMARARTKWWLTGNR